MTRRPKYLDQSEQVKRVERRLEGEVSNHIPLNFDTHFGLASRFFSDFLLFLLSLFCRSSSLLVLYALIFGKILS